MRAMTATSELESVVAAQAREPNSGLIVTPGSFMDVHRAEVTSLAARFRTRTATIRQPPRKPEISLPKLRFSTCYTGSILVKPVTLPPGREKLATKPLATGSDTVAKMMGMVRVSCSSAAVVGVMCERMGGLLSYGNV